MLYCTMNWEIYHKMAKKIIEGNGDVNLKEKKLLMLMYFIQF